MVVGKQVVRVEGGCNGSGLCPMAGFLTSGTESADSTTTPPPEW